MKELILIRHGQSQWNLENRFTGWTDVPLSQKGIEEAKKAGKYLKERGFNPSVAYTSFLKRAIKTLDLVLEELDLSYIPVKKTWRLNERHYGALQGLNKKETADKYGEDQVKIWRRSYDIPPPPLSKDDPRHPCNDPRYKSLDCRFLPSSESLKDTLNRLLPYIQDEIIPTLLKERSIIIAAHGNSLRALVKYLENISDEDIVNLNIPTGIPLVYELSDNLEIINKYYVGDEEEIKKSIEETASIKR